MNFKYIGDEITEWFGFKWLPNGEHDVTDAHAIGKLTNSVIFEAVREDATFEALPPKNKGGRPRKIVTVEAEPNGDDQN